MYTKKFTLIELITVIIVISILFGIVSLTVGKIKDRAIATYIDSTRSILQTAVDTYYLNNENYPIINNSPLSLTKPQQIDLKRLKEEGYLKDEVDYKRIKNQYYWVDVFGRVWGATTETLNNATLLINSDNLTQSMTVNLPEKYEKLAIYEVTNAGNLKVAEANLQNLFASKTFTSNNGKKIKYNKLNEWDSKGNQKFIIQIEDTHKTYLVSGIDKFNLETAPVGANYDAEEFQMIRGKEGVFEYKIESIESKNWIDYIVLEEKPSDSKITYQFAFQDKINGAYGEWTNDFYAVPSSYGIKVKISMKSSTDGLFPTLYGFKIIYNTDAKDLTYEIPSFNEADDNGNPANPFTNTNKISSNKNIIKEKAFDYCEREEKSHSIGRRHFMYYTYHLEDGLLINSIQTPTYSNLELIETKIKRSILGGTYEQVNSLLDLKDNDCVSILFVFEGDYIPVPVAPVISLENKRDANHKIVTVNPKVDGILSIDKGKPDKGETDKEFNPEEKSIGIPDGGRNDDTELNDDNWETIMDFRLFQQGTEKQTIWNRYVSDEVVSEGKTRVLYRFALGDGYYWSKELEDFPTNLSSNALMVHVYLQVHKDYINDKEIPDPIFNSITIFTNNGSHLLSKFKPTVLIYPMKDNNLNRSTISNSSLIQWRTESEDPNGLSITKVEWDKVLNENENTYPTGIHSIKARVQNEIGIWSDWAEYVFEVYEEKPSAMFEEKGKKNYLLYGQEPNLTDLSYDPDGDNIVDKEWLNKKVFVPSDGDKATISLKVKDSEGHWSEPYSKTFHLINENDLWLVDNKLIKEAGFEASFDDDTTTSKDVTQTRFEISWMKDIEGETIKINANSVTRATTFLFLNENGEEIPFLNSEYKLGTRYSHLGDKTVSFLVPEGAKKLIISPERTIHLKEVTIVNEGKKINNISNLNFEGKAYSIVGNYTKPIEVVKTIFIDASTNQIHSINSGETFTNKSLNQNSKYQYKIISFDENFNSSEYLYKVMNTSKADIVFYGSKPESFDGDSSTNFTHTGSAKVTWDGDISGKTLYISTQVVDETGNVKFKFLNASNEELYFLGNNDQYQNVFGGIITRELKVVVPENAKSLNFYGNTAGKNFNFSVTPVNYNIETEGVKNLNINTSEYTIFGSYETSENIVKTYFIDIDNKIVKSINTTNSFIHKSLTPNTNMNYKIISVDENFNASKPIFKTLKTKEAKVNYSGLGMGAFDEDDTTLEKVTGSGTAYWNENIDGKKMYVNTNIPTGYLTIKFLDLEGNLLSYKEIESEVLKTETTISGKKTFVFEVPVNAKSLHFSAHRASIAFNVHSIHIVD